MQTTRREFKVGRSPQGGERERFNLTPPSRQVILPRPSPSTTVVQQLDVDKPDHGLTATFHNPIGGQGTFRTLVSSRTLPEARQK